MVCTAAAALFKSFRIAPFVNNVTAVFNAIAAIGHKKVLSHKLETSFSNQ
jgi:hypothetical protein